MVWAMLSQKRGAQYRRFISQPDMYRKPPFSIHERGLLYKKTNFLYIWLRHCSDINLVDYSKFCPLCAIYFWMYSITLAAPSSVSIRSIGATLSKCELTSSIHLKAFPRLPAIGVANNNTYSSKSGLA